MTALRFYTWLLSGFLLLSSTLAFGHTDDNPTRLRPIALLSSPLQTPDSIFGYVFQDVDSDCLQDAFETGGYVGWEVKLTFFGGGVIVETFTTLTDANGYYVFDQLSAVGPYTGGFLAVTPPPPGSALYCGFSGCPTLQQFGADAGIIGLPANFGFQCDTLPPCPILEVDIATAVIRPCSTSHFVVQYCNVGAETATSPSVAVTMDDALTVTGSSIPWTAVSGNVYTFNLSDLGPGQCGTLQIDATAPCTDPVGTTYCVSAQAYPDTCSLPAGANWDGAEIIVTAACTGDEVVFTIQNIGLNAMSQPLDYVVVEDNVLLMEGSFQLGAGAQTQVTLPANGAFFRLQAEQSPGFPGLNLPIAWAEGCGNADASLGFVNQYALGDAAPSLDVFCLESVNSFDPNDKNGFPRGYGDEHLIEPNTDLEYVIRFQNTGTAPALYVEIRDTLPVQWLDPSSLRPGVSSHDYTWDLQGDGIIVFQFAGINLPDSSANFEASNGFVKFSLSQRGDLPLGTLIRNDAAIFFDNNPPVITNETWHTLGKDFIVAATATAEPAAAWQAVLTPNPAWQVVQLKLAGEGGFGEALTFTLWSALGQPVLREPFAGPVKEFYLGHLAQGLYFYDVRQAGRLMASGRLVRL